MDDANARIQELIQSPYRTEWAGEIEQMKDANNRLLWIIPLSLGLIFILLYCAFRSFLDAIVVLSNVLDVAVGGIWALYLTGTPFSVSAAVGFVSLFGIAIMEGLLLISYFNALRIQGLPLHDAIIQGALKRVRPVMITAMTAILGLLPAAPVDQDRRPDGASAGHRRGRGHGGHLAPGPLSHAGAIHLLRQPPAARGGSELAH